MYLITHSLLNSFFYYRDFDGEPTEAQSDVEREADARKDFLRTLSRVRSDPTPAMQAGIDFENEIYAHCKVSPSEDRVIKEIGDICKGGLWQQVVKRQLGDFLLYGKMDVIKRDTIYDIKRTVSYDIGKYQKSPQHRIYLCCTGIPNFAYLISNGRDWWREDYRNHQNTESEVRQMIGDFMGYLENDPEAKKLFNDNWVSK